MEHGEDFGGLRRVDANIYSLNLARIIHYLCHEEHYTATACTQATGRARSASRQSYHPGSGAGLQSMFGGQKKKICAGPRR